LEKSETSKFNLQSKESIH